MNLTRRDALKAGALGIASTATPTTVSAQVPRAELKSDFKITKGRIRQSVMGWCFKPMPALELAKHCRAIGIEAIEGISAKDYPAVRKLGLKISLVSGGHGFKVRQLTITDEGGGLAADGGKGTGAITTRRRAAKQRVTRKQREMIKDSYRRRD